MIRLKIIRAKLWTWIRRIQKTEKHSIYPHPHWQSIQYLNLTFWVLTFSVSQVAPKTNYKDKYEHLIGKEAAVDAARKTEGVQAVFGMVSAEQKKDRRTVEDIQASSRLVFAETGSWEPVLIVRLSRRRTKTKRELFRPRSELRKDRNLTRSLPSDFIPRLFIDFITFHQFHTHIIIA